MQLCISMGCHLKGTFWLPNGTGQPQISLWLHPSHALTAVDASASSIGWVHQHQSWQNCLGPACFLLGQNLMDGLPFPPWRHRMAALSGTTNCVHMFLHKGCACMLAHIPNSYFVSMRKSWIENTIKVWRIICFATQQQLLGNEPTTYLANSTLKSCMGSQSFNNSLGAKRGSQDMIMVVECKCTGGQPHMARQNMGSQNRLDQVMGCHTCRLCQGMGSQNFNNSLGTKWVSQDMIMVMEYQCVRG